MADNTYEFAQDKDFDTAYALGTTPASSSPIYAGPNSEGYFGVDGGLFTLLGAPVSAAHWSVRFDLHNHGNSATMVGGDWGDVLIGTGFADTINGGQGDDTLEGGGGADTYQFGIGGDRDTINSFQAGIDKVYIARDAALSSANILDLIQNDANGNAVLTIRAGDTITFNGVAKASLLASDFLLENLAPTADISFASYSVIEQTPYSLKGNGLSVSDDSSGGTMTVTLSVSFGILNVAAGTSGATVANSGTSSVTISGTVAQINALLATDGTSSVDLFINSNTPPSTAQLQLSINDNGNGGPGGARTGSDTATIAIGAVNDAPSTSNGHAITDEDTAYVFSVDDFGFSDVDGNSLIAIRIETLPTSGHLFFDNAEITVGQLNILTGSIAQGLLSYVPAADATGAGIGSFTFGVFDDGGVANGGTNLSALKTFSIDVTAANDAPTAADGAVAVSEDTPYAFTAADFSFSDIDGDALAAIEIGTLPSGGVLKLFGVAVTAGTVVNAGLIDAGHLTYTPAADANGVALDSMTFKVIDDSHDANDTSALHTLTFDVAAANDAPVITAPASIAGIEDQPVVITGVSFSDIDAGATAVVVSFAVAPGEGTLAAAASAGIQIFGNDSEALALKGTLADINAYIAASKLTYTPAADANGNVTLGIAISDEGGTGGGGTKTANAGTTLVIGAANDAPVLTGDLSATVTEGGAYVLTGADLGFSDLDDVAAGITFATSSAVHGRLVVGGVTVNSFTGAELAAGLVSFVHDGAEEATASFKVAVEDGDEDHSVPPAPASFTLTVTPVNDAPTVTVTPVRTAIGENADTSGPIKIATIAVSDADGGTNVLSLSGADKNLFVIDNNELYLKAGVKLDFESNSKLDVTVDVDDASVGSTPDASASLSINVTDVAEKVAGNSKDNVLRGTAVAEILDGKGGDDTIKGGGGADTIIGGHGEDVLTGGGGADVFVFRPGDMPKVGAIQHWLSPLTLPHDTITDFKPGVDTIDLSAIDADSKKDGNQKFHFEGWDNLSGSRGELVYEFYGDKASARHTLVKGDTNGDGAYDVLVVLEGHHHLHAGDFIL